MNEYGVNTQQLPHYVYFTTAWLETKATLFTGFIQEFLDFPSESEEKY